MRRVNCYAFRLFIGISLAVLLYAVNEALGLLAVAIYVAIATIVVWRRTRLPLMTLGGSLGALYLMVISGKVFITGSSEGLGGGGLLSIALIVTLVLLVAIEKCWHPVAMKEWETAIKNASLRDMLLLNDIPRLVTRDLDSDVSFPKTPSDDDSA